MRGCDGIGRERAARQEGWLDMAGWDRRIGWGIGVGGWVTALAFGLLWAHRLPPSAEPGEPPAPTDPARLAPVADGNAVEAQLRRRVSEAMAEARQAKADAQLWRVRAQQAEYRAATGGAQPAEGGAAPARQAVVKNTLLRLVTHPDDLTGHLFHQLGVNVTSDELRAMADALPRDAMRMQAIRRLLNVWAQTDPDGALEWMKGIETETEFRMTAIWLAGSWARTDPDAAGRWIETLPKGPAREGAIREYIVAVAGNPKLAAEWYERVENATVRAAVAPTIAGHYWEQDPQAAAEWVKRIPDRNLRENAIQSVAFRGAEKDVDGVLNWCAAMMDDKQFERTAPWIAARLANQDAAAAAYWIDNLPRGDVRDRCIQQATAALARTDVRAGAEWLAGIENPAFRQQAAQQIAWAWGRTDAAGALAWIDGARLDAATRERFRAHVERGRASVADSSGTSPR